MVVVDHPFLSAQLAYFYFILCVYMTHFQPSNGYWKPDVNAPFDEVRLITSEKKRANNTARELSIELESLSADIQYAKDKATHLEMNNEVHQLQSSILAAKYKTKQLLEDINSPSTKREKRSVALWLMITVCCGRVWCVCVCVCVPWPCDCDWQHNTIQRRNKCCGCPNAHFFFL